MNITSKIIYISYEYLKTTRHWVLDLEINTWKNVLCTVNYDTNLWCDLFVKLLAEF